MNDSIEELLNYPPYNLPYNDKMKIFNYAMKESCKHHYKKNIYFQNLCNFSNFQIDSEFILSDIPYIPVPQFKKQVPLSVPQDQIITTIRSSSTTSNTPSVIQIDKVTAQRQSRALQKIMEELMGGIRRDFLIIDTADQIQKKEGNLSSRGSAIRGFLPFMKSANFFLEDDLTLNKSKLIDFLNSNDSPKAIFGFTWVLYLVLENISEELVKDKNDIVVLHIGGWKKLRDRNISKEDFNKLIKRHFKTDKIFDIYGMTEQLGTIYPDCKFGYKHVPTYSELIVRDLTSLEDIGVGKPGFMQFLSPIPHSYPGISILSDDIGEIIGRDDCKCGRKGAYFVFVKRADKAELKGCGDTFM